MYRKHLLVESRVGESGVVDVNNLPDIHADCYLIPNVRELNPMKQANTWLKPFIRLDSSL
jgi:hypothetical protein